MGKFSRSAATSYDLSLAAMEEASRDGLREADLAHLLMALSISEQVGGQVLRAAGVTLQRVRQAVAEEREVQLRALGVDRASVTPGPIVFHQTGGYEWSRRAQRVLTRANSRGRDGTASAVLRELLDEPSGAIVSLLGGLGVTRGELVAELDAVERLTASGAGGGVPSGGGVLQRSAVTFVPATVSDVWALLADPARMPEWDILLGEVEVPDESRARVPRPGETWEGRAKSERPDGAPLKIRQALRRTVVELLAFRPEELISWRMTTPDEPRANARRVTVGLEPAAGGTRLNISFAWEAVVREPASIARRVRRLLMTPAMRFAVWMQLSQIGSGISRVFRSDG